jgi:hypothetical protein
LTRKVVSGVLYPCNSDKTNAQKSEIFTKIDVYSYSRPTDMHLVGLGYSVGVVG